MTLSAEGALGEGLTCSVQTGQALVAAGLHPASGGDGLSACSGDMLLRRSWHAPASRCCAVATSLGLEMRDGRVHAEGDLDFRGTLGVDKAVPVGFTDIRLTFDLDTDAETEQLARCCG